MEVGLGQSDIVLDCNPGPLPKKGTESPIFGPCLLCHGQTAGWIKMAFGVEVGLGPGHIVLDEHPSPLPKMGHSPQFSVHFYCGQTAGCVMMPLGMEVGLGPGDFVFDGDPTTPRKMGTPPSSPNFWPMSIVTKRLDG